MHRNVFIDIVSTNVKVLHNSGGESCNFEQVEKKVKFHTKGTVDIIYGQFDQNEQPFRTKA